MRTIGNFAAIVILLAGCAGDKVEGTSGTFTVTGAVHAMGQPTFDSVAIGDLGCSSDGADGPDVGDQVVVKDPDAGKTLGLGTLGYGTYAIAEGPIDLPDVPGTDDLPGQTECAFQFAVSDIPEGLKFYAITVKGTTRQFTRDELKNEVTLAAG